MSVLDPTHCNFYKIVWPLLKSLGFQGEGRVVIEAFPHLLKSLTIEDLQEFMSHLGYSSIKKKLKLRYIPSHPGIFIEKKAIYFIPESTEDKIDLVNLETTEKSTVSRNTEMKGYFYYFYKNTENRNSNTTWIHTIVARFKKQGYHLLGIGLLNAVFALTLPFFIRAVFDWAIPTKSLVTLDYLLFGLGIALFCQHLIHTYQNKTLAYIGARLSMIISTEVVAKILKLPYSFVEKASVPEQISRIKQFERIKDFFTSPLAQLILEGPFVLFFLIVLGFIGGPLVSIPIILIAIFIIFAGIIFPTIRSSTHLSSYTYNSRLSFMIEAFSKINTLKFLGAEKIFAKRFEEKTYNQSKASESNDIIMSYAINTSQILVKLAGIVTIFWGAERVMDGQMTLGSLVAVVLLIWRALSPIQAAFMFFSQFDLTLTTIHQINQLMSLPIENYSGIHTKQPKIRGYVYCENIAFRYPSSASFALQGITLEAQPGEIVAIMGENASGKSTLIKLLMGLYPPNAGHIFVDHYDVRHLPINHLRQSFACVPQTTQFFHGSIEQNLLLADPSATHERLIDACKKALVWGDIENLSKGLQTQLSDRTVSLLNTGFKQKLSLARAYLRNSPILLMDEPGSNLDFESDEWLKHTLLSHHGEKTTIIVTHRPSVINLSDRLLVLSNGRMKYFGPTHKVLEIMQQGKRA